MRKPKSVLVVYKPIIFRGLKNYELLQVNVKTNDRINIPLYSNGKYPSIANPYFDTIYSIYVEVVQLLKKNGFIPNYTYHSNQRIVLKGALHMDLCYKCYAEFTKIRKIWDYECPDI